MFRIERSHHTAPAVALPRNHHGSKYWLQHPKKPSFTDVVKGNRHCKTEAEVINIYAVDSYGRRHEILPIHSVIESDMRTAFKLVKEKTCNERTKYDGLPRLHVPRHGGREKVEQGPDVQERNARPTLQAPTT